MPTTTTYLAWRHTPNDTGRLTLHVGQADIHVPKADVRVPKAVAAILLRNPARPLGDDPARDLLVAEQDLRAEIQYATDQLDAATAVVAVARAGVDAGATSRAARNAASQHWADAVATHTAWSQRHEDIVERHAALRQFVVDLAVPDGLLGEARLGWQRNCEAPDYVVVFATEDEFIAGDTRRGVPAWWGPTEPGGQEFGAQWRRDPDDPIIDPPGKAEGIGLRALERGGTWRLRWHRDEVYAMRRAPGRDELVWLLASGLADADDVTGLLTELETRMLAPNSLLLAAEEIHRYARRADCQPIGR
jgi:hypothetical protein